MLEGEPVSAAALRAARGARASSVERPRAVPHPLALRRRAARSTLLHFHWPQGYWRANSRAAASGGPLAAGSTSRSSPRGSPRRAGRSGTASRGRSTRSTRTSAPPRLDRIGAQAARARHADVLLAHDAATAADASGGARPRGAPTSSVVAARLVHRRLPPGRPRPRYARELGPRRRPARLPALRRPARLQGRRPAARAPSGRPSSPDAALVVAGVDRRRERGASSRRPRRTTRGSCRSSASSPTIGSRSSTAPPTRGRGAQRRRHVRLADPRALDGQARGRRATGRAYRDAARRRRRPAGSSSPATSRLARAAPSSARPAATPAERGAKGRSRAGAAPSARLAGDRPSRRPTCSCRGAGRDAHEQARRPRRRRAAELHEGRARSTPRSSGAGVEQRLVHTGQHYDASVERRLLRGAPAARAARQARGAAREPTARRPPGRSRGSSRSSSSSSRTSSSCPATSTRRSPARSRPSSSHIPVCHLEAGLRSFDWAMPEEHNRRLTDHVSTLLLTHSEEAHENLARRGHPGRADRVRRQHDDRHALPERRQGARALEAWREFGVARARVRARHAPPAGARRRRPSCSTQTMRGARASWRESCRSSSRCTRAPAARSRSSGSRSRAGSGSSSRSRTAASSRSRPARCAVVTDSGGVQEETTALGDPLLHAPRQHRAAGHGHATGRTRARARPRPSRSSPSTWSSSLRRRHRRRFWDGHAGERAADEIEARSASSGRRCRAPQPAVARAARAARHAHGTGGWTRCGSADPERPRVEGGVADLPPARARRRRRHPRAAPDARPTTASRRWCSSSRASS